MEPKLLVRGDKVTKLRGDEAALDGRAFAGWTGDRLIGRCRLFVRASALATSALLNVGGGIALLNVGGGMPCIRISRAPQRRLFGNDLFNLS